MPNPEEQGTEQAAPPSPPPAAPPPPPPPPAQEAQAPAAPPTTTAVPTSMPAPTTTTPAATTTTPATTPTGGAAAAPTAAEGTAAASGATTDQAAAPAAPDKKDGFYFDRTGTGYEGESWGVGAGAGGGQSGLKVRVGDTNVTLGADAQGQKLTVAQQTDDATYTGTVGGSFTEEDKLAVRTSFGKEAKGGESGFEVSAGFRQAGETYTGEGGFSRHSGDASDAASLALTAGGGTTGVQASYSGKRGEQTFGGAAGGEVTDRGVSYNASGNYGDAGRRLDLSAGVSGSETTDAQGRESDSVNVRTAVGVGDTRVAATVGHQTAGATGADVNQGSLTVTQSDIDLGGGRKLQVTGDGSVKVDEAPGAETTGTGGVAGTVTLGEGESVSGSLRAGRETAGGIASQLHVDPALAAAAGIAPGYGSFGKVGGNYSKDGFSVGGDLGVGVTDEGRVLTGLEANLGLDALRVKVDAGLAVADGELAGGNFGVDASMGLGHGFDVNAGGSVLYNPAAEDAVSWAARAGMGWKRGAHAVSAGVDFTGGGGAETLITPKAGYMYDETVGVDALASFGDESGFRAAGMMVRLPGAGLSAGVGYGDAAALAGQGMRIPTPEGMPGSLGGGEQGGFVAGAYWEPLAPFLRK